MVSAPAPSQPGTMGFCASTIWVCSLCSPAGALPLPPLAPLHLSLHAFTFGRTRSSCLETCCSLLCLQGQRYLDLSSSGRGGLGRSRGLVWSKGEEASIP